MRKVPFQNSTSINAGREMLDERREINLVRRPIESSRILLIDGRD